MSVTVTQARTSTRPQSYPPPRPQFTSLSAASPPPYSRLSVSTLPAYPNAAELNISSTSQGRTTGGHSRGQKVFDYALERRSSSGHSHSNSKTPWISLRLLSNVPRAAQRPRYIGGEMVEGSISLNVDKVTSVSSIVVILRGRVVTSSLAEGSHLFLEHVHPVWNKDTARDLPVEASPRPPSDLARGKFCGEFQWPFAFPFPTEFSTRKGTTTCRHPTPQTLVERGINTTIIYEIVVKVVTGFFRNKHRIVANVLYVPLITAPPLPPLRSDAYQLGTYLPSPREDDTGWSSVALIKLRVSMPSPAEDDVEEIRSIEVAGTVYIAKPSVYSRGTVLPCYLISRIESDVPPSDQDIALLETFTAERCISVSLVRRMSYFSDTKQSASAVAAFGGHAPSAKSPGTLETTEHLKKVGSALWWPPQRFESRDIVSHGGSEEVASTLSPLEGEIHLNDDLTPSCDVPFLSVSYHISISLSTPTSQTLIVERIRPHAEPTLPKPRLRKWSSKTSSNSKTGSAGGAPYVSSSESLNSSTRGGSSSASASGKSTSGATPSEEIASIPVTIVTSKGEGPLPVSFLPRSHPKKPDASTTNLIDMDMGGRVSGWVSPFG